MGSALLEGWLESKIQPENINIIEPNQEISKVTSQKFGVNCFDHISKLPRSLTPHVILFAIKPHFLDSVVPEFARFSNKNPTFISIAAGKAMRFFSERLSPDTAIVRAMPNTPAAVGRGITVVIKNEYTLKHQHETAENLLSATGEICWITDESYMDSVTALSGGGPAYVFLLTECLTKAGVELGLPQELSKRLARVTVAGAGELLHLLPEDPATLRKNVTSPGGTTAEALKILMDEEGWQPLISRALKAAKEKSQKLAL